MFGFFKQTYSIKKDAKPKDTLKRLRAIFCGLGIKLTESNFFNYDRDKSAPCSLRITIENTNIGANGKGKTPITALCSAYAELIERLQSGMVLFLKNSKFLSAPDEKKFPVDLYYENYKSYLKDSFSFANFYNNVSEEDIKQALCTISKIESFSFKSNENGVISCVPFYDVLNDVIEYLPFYFIGLKNTTNGLSAGNTKEEALVQGLSEIFERYVQREVILNNLILPIVPEKYYRKFFEIDRIIKFLEKSGFKIIVKDASIGKSIPVVMTVFVDNNLKKISYSMGSHPDFIIALERTLTEFLQGYSVLNKVDRNTISLVTLIESEDEKVYKEQSLTVGANTHIKFEHPFAKVLLSEESSFPLNLKYICKKNNLSNKQMLKEMIVIVKTFSSKFYVRDISFLGFDAVSIEIPAMSKMQLRLLDIIEYRYKFDKFVAFLSDMNANKQPSPDDIILVTTHIQCLYYDREFYLIPSVPNIFIAAIAYLEKGNVELSIDALNTVLQHDKVFVMYLPLVKALHDVLIGKKQISDIEDENIRKSVDEFISEPLKTLWRFIDEIKLKCDFEEKAEKENNKRQRIKEILVSKYIENTPNQENLREFFKEILAQD